MRNFRTLSFSLGALLWLGSAKAADRQPQSDTENIEGWITKRTKDGKILRIPKKQVFRFGGSQVQGEAVRPGESVLTPRSSPRPLSLLPERTNFRKDFFDSLGAPEPERR